MIQLMRHFLNQIVGLKCHLYLFLAHLKAAAEDEQHRELQQTVHHTDKQCIYSTSTLQHSALNEIFCRAEVRRHTVTHEALRPCLKLKMVFMGDKCIRDDASRFIIINSNNSVIDACWKEKFRPNLTLHFPQERNISMTMFVESTKPV
jgi:hypothetical protein